MSMPGGMQWLVVCLLAACGSSQRAPDPVVVPPSTGTLTLTYEGAPFDGPSLLFVVLHAADGTAHPLQLSPHEYTAFRACGQCPADGPAVEHSPSPGGPPPKHYDAGVLTRYESATFTKD